MNTTASQQLSQDGSPVKPPERGHKWTNRPLLDRLHRVLSLSLPIFAEAMESLAEGSGVGLDLPDRKSPSVPSRGKHGAHA